MMENKEKLMDWLKNELAIENIQVIVPPSEEQLKDVIKDCMKYPFMRELFKKVADLCDYQDKKREYKGKLRLMKECFNCKGVTIHRFVDFEDTAINKLKCLNCDHIGYFINRANFNLFYDDKKIEIGDLSLFINCEHPFHIISCNHCERYEQCAEDNRDSIDKMDRKLFYK